MDAMQDMQRMQGAPRKQFNRQQTFTVIDKLVWYSAELLYHCIPNIFIIRSCLLPRVALVSIANRREVHMNPTSDHLFMRFQVRFRKALSHQPNKAHWEVKQTQVYIKSSSKNVPCGFDLLRLPYVSELCGMGELVMGSFSSVPSAIPLAIWHW